jgi:DNA-binding NtrC family response regulator
MRRAPRVPVDLPVNLYLLSQTVKGRITDLSLTGAHIALPEKVKLHVPIVDLKFSLLSGKSPDLEVLARVVRPSAAGVGVEFLDLDSHNRSRLWDALQPLLPPRFETCPFCSKEINGRGVKLCPACQLPQALHLVGYQDWFGDANSGEPEEMVGVSEPMRRVFNLIRKVAATDLPVLITGASGTGKEMVARSIHQRSLRAEGPFVAINCAAIPRELLESELFGHEKGAFTGAYQTSLGTVERAQRGTLFLDEVGELPLELQVKLLRFLQEFTFERVGGHKTMEADLRVISATNSDLTNLIKEGNFREDLYYRLDVLRVALPLLKDRDDDLLIMATIFLKRYASRVGKKDLRFSKEAMTAILAHNWPGNIRELTNRIRRSVVMADGPLIAPEHLGIVVPHLDPEPHDDGLSLKEAKARFEAQLIAQVLAKYNGNVSLAAKALRTSRSMLYNLIQKYDLNGAFEKSHTNTLSRQEDRITLSRSAT